MHWNSWWWWWWEFVIGINECWKIDTDILIGSIALQVEQRRGLTLGDGSGYRLILRHVSEHGWTNSKVTKYRSVFAGNFRRFDVRNHHISHPTQIKLIFVHRTDFENNRIIYSQDFPEKSLDGEYEFKGLMFGRPFITKGIWNMTLFDYAWVIKHLVKNIQMEIYTNNLKDSLFSRVF